MYTLVGTLFPLIFIVSSTWEKQMPSQIVPQIADDTYHAPYSTLLSCLDIRVILYCSLDYIVQHTAASFPGMCSPFEHAQ